MAKLIIELEVFGLDESVVWPSGKNTDPREVAGVILTWDDFGGHSLSECAHGLVLPADGLKLLGAEWGSNG